MPLKHFSFWPHCSEVEGLISYISCKLALCSLPSLGGGMPVKRCLLFIQEHLSLYVWNTHKESITTQSNLTISFHFELAGRSQRIYIYGSITGELLLAEMRNPVKRIFMFSWISLSILNLQCLLIQ